MNSPPTRQEKAKYNMRLNPVYQVDFGQEAIGKRLASTKRRIHWTFGFSDPKAISAGYSGVECRGEEFSVTLIWSLSSGKRLVKVNGKEVHYSQGKCMEGKFETYWPMAGGHIVKIIVHSSVPVFPTPGFRQFDLFLDGFSFFDMPKIYELGAKSPTKNFITPSISSTTSVASYSISEQRSFTPERQARQFGFADENSDSSVAAVADIESVQSCPKEADLLFDNVYTTGNNSSSSTDMNQASKFALTASEQNTTGTTSTKTVPVNQLQKLGKDYQAYRCFGQEQASTQDSSKPQPFDFNPTPLMQEQDLAPPYLRNTKTTEYVSNQDEEARDAPPMPELDQAAHSLVNMKATSETRGTPQQQESQNKNKMTGQSFRSPEPLSETESEWSLGPQQPLGDRSRAPPSQNPGNQSPAAYGFHQHQSAYIA